jgi:hypothetical protein
MGFRKYAHSAVRILAERLDLQSIDIQLEATQIVLSTGHVKYVLK